MSDCVEIHDDCSKQSAILDNSSRPARRLDLRTIQRSNESGIRLIETVSGSSYQYARLSYRFDDAIKSH